MKKYSIIILTTVFLTLIFAQALRAEWTKINNSGLQNGANIFCFNDTVKIHDKLDTTDVIRTSTNGGNSWTNNSMGFRAYVVFFLTSQKGWAVSANYPSYVYRTSNGGINWTRGFQLGYFNDLYQPDQLFFVKDRVSY